MRISDWSSDVCSSDLVARALAAGQGRQLGDAEQAQHAAGARLDVDQLPVPGREREPALQVDHAESGRAAGPGRVEMRLAVAARHAPAITERSAEHTSELQPLMRSQDACL